MSGNVTKAASAATSRRLGRAEYIGPGWKLEDWLRFKKLCTEAILLEPDTNPMGGLMGFRRKSRFADLPQAREALGKNSIYRWLSKKIPLAINAENDSTPFIQFRRVRAVAESLVFGSGLPLRPIRADKQRRSAASSAETLLQCLNSGVLSLSNMAREEFLEELLEEAVRFLQSGQRQPKAHKYPWIRRLAFELQQQTGVADAKMLLEVATALSLDCDERTAQNYAKEARQRASEK